MYKSSSLYFNHSAWDKLGADNISRKTFMLFVGIFIIFGLLISAACAFKALSWVKSVSANEVNYIGPSLFMLVPGVLLCIATGWLMSKVRKNSLILHMCGYLLIAGPLWLLIGTVMAIYTKINVVNVLAATICVTTVFSLMSSIAPRKVQSFRGLVVSCLVVFMVGKLGFPLLHAYLPGLPVSGGLKFGEWISVALFSAYIYVDMNRSMMVPATVQNAIDCSFAIYTDLLNMIARMFIKEA